MRKVEAFDPVNDAHPPTRRERLMSAARNEFEGAAQCALREYLEEVVRSNNTHPKTHTSLMTLACRIRSASLRYQAKLRKMRGA